MIYELKQMLLENPDNIISLLEWYDFEHIKLSESEIRFARDECGGQNIAIYIRNNPFLNVNDYARDVRCDIFSYIMMMRGCTLHNVIVVTKRILNLDDKWTPKKKRRIFGGIYEGLKKHEIDSFKIYDESILDKYDAVCSERFLQEGIQLKSQKKFHIMFDSVEDCIILPIKSPYGDLIGVKSRLNYESEDLPKYYYPVKCAAGQTLYGYAENYDSLYGNDVFIFESEKSVMLCDSYGYNNCVALGGNNLSDAQAKLIASLHPKRVVFLLDSNLDLKITYRNAHKLHDMNVWFWDWRDNLDVDEKDSPVDKGKDVFENILCSELRSVNNGIS